MQYKNFFLMLCMLGSYAFVLPQEEAAPQATPEEVAQQPAAQAAPAAEAPTPAPAAEQKPAEQPAQPEQTQPAAPAEQASQSQAAAQGQPPAEQPAAEQPSSPQQPQPEQAQPEQASPDQAQPTAPVLPVPTRQKAVTQKEKPEPAVNYGPGIDTVDIESGGNWLLKRVIWEDAERTQEKIQKLNRRVLEDRIEFFTKRSTSDKELNLFYVSIGFSQGELEEIINSLLALLEKERALHGSLTEQERGLYAQLMEKKGDLEQLRTDIQSMVDLDAALDSALTQLIQQIDLANNYEQQAWQKFKEIGQELDDKKARDYYAHMETAAKNITAIDDYIKGPFANYFNSVLQKIMNSMGSVKTRLDALRQSGIELKTHLAEFEKAAQAPAAAPEKQVKKETSWYDSVAVVWRYPISFVQWLWNYWYGLLFKTKA